jgi:hypothetical protein
MEQCSAWIGLCLELTRRVPQAIDLLAIIHSVAVIELGLRDLGNRNSEYSNPLSASRLSQLHQILKRLKRYEERSDSFIKGTWKD